MNINKVNGKNLLSIPEYEEKFLLNYLKYINFQQVF